MKLSTISSVINASCLAANLDLNCSGFSIDSRSLQAGELFIALDGPNYSGQNFIAAARRAGAAAAIVADSFTQEVTNWPILKVPDPMQALTKLARYKRQQFSGAMVAVTGSCGKTTTKELLSSIFNCCGSSLTSEKSYNNHIGVPLTLLKITDHHQYAVCELGANHPGEIATLTKLVRPKVAVLLNAAPAHLAGFGDLNGVARAKAEIFLGLAKDGVAVINQDDNFATFWSELLGNSNKSARNLSFGVANKADVMASDVELNTAMQPQFNLMLPTRPVTTKLRIELKLIGTHNVVNAIAAAAAAYACGVAPAKIKQGLEQCGATEKRLVKLSGLAGAAVVDDSYNANPKSAMAAIELLSQYKGHSILVFADMGELGASSAESHRQIGRAAAQAGIKKLYCYGEYSKFTARAFGDDAYHFSDKSLLTEALINELKLNAKRELKTMVLIKGSRAMQMEQVVEKILC